MTKHKTSSLLVLLLFTAFTLVECASKKYGSTENFQVQQLTSAEVKERIKIMDIIAVKNNEKVKTSSTASGSTENQQIYVFKDGAVTEGFDPTIASKTCQAAPTQIKVYDSQAALEKNTDMKIFQDFSITLPSKRLTGTNPSKSFDVSVQVKGLNDPINP